MFNVHIIYSEARPQVLCNLDECKLHLLAYPDVNCPTCLLLASGRIKARKFWVVDCISKCMHRYVNGCVVIYLVCDLPICDLPIM